jgi:GntR family transcriptional regulator of arabinose operon
MASAGFKAAPQYAQIKRRLIAEIESGRWAAGGVFPSEAQLLARYKVSRATLVRSLQELTLEGYLYRRQGQGTFVADFRRGRRAEQALPLFISDKTYSLSGSGRQVLLRILSGIEDALGPLHPGVTIRQVPERELNEETRQSVASLRPSVALVVEPSFNPQLVDLLHRQSCAIWSVNEAMQDDNCVYIDQERAGYMATKYLLDKGRRRIALLNGPVDAYWGFEARFRGYRRALESAGIAFDPRLSREGKHLIDSEAGRSMLRAIFDEGVAVDAAVGASDAKALGAIAVAQEADRRIPDDLLVVSIDNTIADQAEVPLTSVAMPFEEVGRQAALGIKGRTQPAAVGGSPSDSASLEQPPVQQIKLLPSLVERG